jgi:hypothetical protein
LAIIRVQKGSCETYIRHRPAFFCCDAVVGWWNSQVPTHDAHIRQPRRRGNNTDADDCEQPHPINVPITTPSKQASRQGGCDATMHLPVLFGRLSVCRSICRPPAHRAVSGELLRACGYGSASRETDCQTLLHSELCIFTPHPPHTCVIGDVGLGFWMGLLVASFCLSYRDR